MTDTLYLRPAADRRVRDPITAEPLPDTGEAKPANSYWLRRLADGDVVEAQDKRPKSVKGDK